MRDSLVKDDRDNFGAIAGVLFFGVPNQGMDIRSLIPMVGEQANRGFPHTLESNSPVLRTQALMFSETVAKLHCDVINFYETQESPTAKQNVGRLDSILAFNGKSSQGGILPVSSLLISLHHSWTLPVTENDGE